MVPFLFASRHWRLCLLGSILSCAACTALPSLHGRDVSRAYTDTQGTALGKVLEPLMAAHPGRSAVYPLLDARDAFAARAHLAQVAERSLDIQYYIRQKDLTGTLLFDMLGAAAGEASVLAGLAAGRQAMMQQEAADAYTRSLRDSPFVQELMVARLQLEWAPTRMVSDDPAKGLGRASQQSLVKEMLKTVVGEPSSRISLVSPYFVPSAEAVDMFGSWAEQGMRVEILTNSLEATDVAAVHAGYVKRRRDLLEAGVALLELRRTAPGIRVERDGIGSSSGSSLHAKTFAVDDARVFIGSFNFDPRSATLNTEMGFVIDSPALARRVHGAFDQRVPEDAYRVLLAGDGSLAWEERKESGTIRHQTEPGTTAWQRFMVWLLSLLPIDGLL